MGDCVCGDLCVGACVYVRVCARVCDVLVIGGVCVMSCVIMSGMFDMCAMCNVYVMCARAYLSGGGEIPQLVKAQDC